MHVVKETKRQETKELPAHLLTVSRERAVEWHEYGVTDGSHRQVVLYCHGTPGSGLEAEVFDRVAQERGVLVLAPDRPGLGGSGSLAKRPVATAGQDAAAVLAARQVENCLVIGYSGGGPHALALALAEPDRVSGVALLAPFTHRNRISKNIQLTIAPTNMSLQKYTYRALCSPALHRGTTAIMRQLKRVSRSSTGLISALNTDLSGHLYLDSLLHSHVHALEKSTRGALDDLTALHSPWGFEPTGLPGGMHLDVWIGGKDRVVSAKGARDLARQLGGQVHELPGHGHTALFALAAPEALTTLLERASYPRPT